MKNILIGFVLLACISCLGKGIPARNKIDYSHLENTVADRRRPAGITFDSIRIDAGEGDALSSMMGYFYLKNDTIGFADRQLATIFLYDSTGRFLRSHLQRGRGPNETLGLDKFGLFPDNRMVILDGNGYLSVFTPRWQKESQTEICWYKHKNEKELKRLKNSKDVNEPAVYFFEFEGGNIKPWDNRHLLIPINIELPKCNAYLSPCAGYYYENAYSLGIIDCDSGRLLQMLCPRPPVYGAYKYLPNFRHILFDSYNDTLFFSFQADSLIYRTVLPLATQVQACGMAGKDMNTDYRTTDTYDSCVKNNDEDRVRYGHYTYLKYIPQTGLLFRGYHPGNNHPAEGVQVYSGNHLLYDFEVPAQFEVFGYKAPYYYARIAPDETNDEMIIYKFKLDRP